MHPYMSPLLLFFGDCSLFVDLISWVHVWHPFQACTWQLSLITSVLLPCHVILSSIDVVLFAGCLQQRIQQIHVLQPFKRLLYSTISSQVQQPYVTELILVSSYYPRTKIKKIIATCQNRTYRYSCAQWLPNITLLLELRVAESQHELYTAPAAIVLFSI